MTVRSLLTTAPLWLRRISQALIKRRVLAAPLVFWSASVRQDGRWLAFKPYLPATSFEVTPGRKLSETIRLYLVIKRDVTRATEADSTSPRLGD